MKRLMLLLTAVLLLVFVNHAVAESNMNVAVSKIESDISNALKIIGADLKNTAKEASRLSASQESGIRRLLLGLCNKRPYVIDAAFINSAGIMKIIEPEEYKKYEGSDISNQEAIILMQKTRKPGMSKTFDSVEGVKSVDIEYPVFSGNRKFSGSVSLLIKHDEFVRTYAAPVEKEMGVKCWVMQKNGVIIYETNPSQTGLNIFESQIYKDYPELILLAKRMIKEKNGTGRYTFLLQGADRVVKKKALWRTIRFFNNDWIVVVYKEVK